MKVMLIHPKDGLVSKKLFFNIVKMSEAVFLVMSDPSMNKP